MSRPSSEYYLAWVDRDGRLTRVSDTPRPFRNVKASPDGRRIATVIGTSTESDLWLVDANGTFSRLSFGLSPHRPTWTSSGGGDHRRRTEGRHLAAAHVGRRRQGRADGPVREPEPALSECVVARRPLLDLSGEPAGHRLGSARARGRCVRTSGWRPAGVCEHAVSRNERRDLARRSMGLVRVGRDRWCDPDLRALLPGWRPQDPRLAVRRAMAGLGLARQPSLLADPGRHDVGGSHHGEERAAGRRHAAGRLARCGCDSHSEAHRQPLWGARATTSTPAAHDFSCSRAPAIGSTPEFSHPLIVLDWAQPAALIESTE